MSTGNTVNLYRRAYGNITLDAFLKLPEETTTGIFYTPACCCFGVVERGKDPQVSEPRFDRKTVFEIRLFNENGKWHWLRDPADGEHQGRAVGLSEQPPENDWTLVKTPLTALDQYYLLWGEPLPETETMKNPAPGWQWLSSAQIGRLAVPKSDKQRLRLRSREYLGLAPGEAGEHGNVVVLEERLVDIEVYPGEKNHG